MLQLRDYQETFVRNIAISLNKNKKIVAQLATGGGKTVTFSAIAKRFIDKSGQRVLILVHRMELLNQAAKTIERNTGLKAAPIIAGMKAIPDAMIYVAMVETTYRRLDKLPDFGLIIIDEVHIGNFTKIIEHYSNKYITGFTATPIAAKKINPLKKYFNHIVCGISISNLINEGHLCPAYTFGVKQEIDRAKLKMVRGDFDIQQMAMMMSDNKYVQSVVDAYSRLAIGSKTLIFNCNVAHSQLVTEAFIKSGFNARHLDGEMNPEQRSEIMQWFNCNDDAILCNIGIATTGFDQPDVKCIIINRATASMPLWLQMCGRGSRNAQGKESFIIIDMGGNVTTHGFWEAERDWSDLFYNPAKKGNGIAPTKKCPKCEGFVHTRVMTCNLPMIGSLFPDQPCGYQWPVKEIAECEPADIVALTKNVDVDYFIEFSRENNHKEYSSLFKSLSRFINIASGKAKYLTPDISGSIIEGAEKIAREWSNKIGHKTARAALYIARDFTKKELNTKFPTWKKHSYLSTTM